MFVVKHMKIWFALSALLILLSVGALVSYGFNFSIDFKGGTITEVRYDAERPSKEILEGEIGKLGLGGFSLRPSGDKSYVIRTKELSEAERGTLATVLSLSSSTYSIERQNTIGPVAGAELRSKATTAIAVVVVMILLFITFAFRKVSSAEQREKGLPASWKYGLATIIALAHDVIIPTGIFAYLGYHFGFEIDLLFVTGLLAILGYSVHDSIVVFDRVRENLRINEEKRNGEPFDVTVGKSVTQTMARSINTSLTTFILLLALYILGPASIKNFALLMTIGIIIGAYSSILVASPLLVTFSKLQKSSN